MSKIEGFEYLCKNVSINLLIRYLKAFIVGQSGLARNDSVR